ncbi:MAG: tetratricopeptide repeat protein, partial [Gammaproteobacteria bacterium]|nr:tetratricopeptide repeat protein [Gammaproteobacteria bacterium]
MPNNDNTMTSDKKITINTFAEFQEKVLKLKGVFAYRGQKDKDWGIESGAYRRLQGNVNTDLLKYTNEIIGKAKNYTQEVGNKSDLDLLGDLQHFGCATPLIDFSYNALTALWFACEDSTKDGKLVCLKTNEIERFLKVSREDKKQSLNQILSFTIRETGSYKFGLWQPPLNNNRIIKQDSLFIFTETGKIADTEFAVTFIIPKGAKPAIRTALDHLCNITQTSIYPDFYGFANSNNADNEYQELPIDELTEQADQYFQEGKYLKAKPYYEDALKTAEKEEDTAAIAKCQNNVGFILDELGDPKKAIEYYELALASDLSSYGEADPKVAILRNNIGGAWHALGEFEKAIEYYELALASDLNSYGEAHPNVATYRNNLGMAWKALGKPKKAIEYYELALESDLNSYGEAHPNVATRRNNLGGAWQALGELEKAIGYYELALASGLKSYGEAHPEVATYRNNLGGAWHALGEFEKAIEYYELALESDLKSYGEAH